MKKNITGVGEVTVPSTLKEKAQNFWYHYKWHSIAATILIIALLVCSLQFCTKESYDAYILYAGSHNVGRTAKDGDVAEIVTMISSLKRVSEDYDENGELSVNFTNYYFLSTEEQRELSDVNSALLNSDKSALSSAFENSEYFLAFVSVAVYEQYHKVGADERFISLTSYKEINPEIEYYSDNAIYLSSTDAYKLPGLSNLPEDTLICIRVPNLLEAKSDSHSLHYENAKKMLVNILKLDIE